MKVSAAGTSFTGQAYTNKGNQYKKTNLGKWIGMGVGAAVVGIRAYKTREFLGMICKQGAAAKLVVAGVLAAIVAAGLGLGAIVDACVNSSRRGKADKTAQSNTQV
ncbi:MAG: hypothetical protein LBK53_04965 [Heliobacteriaceae bacterium]|jgi:hypothetical protein|nr:hypothetical protein [Heliobacteriaceae bacterium]